MYSLNIFSEVVYFEDIKLESLPGILKWYNRVEDFGFATGIDHIISLDALKRKYAEVAICSNEFFVGIYTKKAKEMVGILKGRIGYENKSSAWISSIIIDTIYQNQGYGSAAIDLIFNYLKSNLGINTIYLAVFEDNSRGKLFWEKHKFKELRKIKKYTTFQNKSKDVIIMQKSI